MGNEPEVTVFLANVVQRRAGDYLELFIGEVSRPVDGNQTLGWRAVGTGQ